MFMPFQFFKFRLKTCRFFYFHRKLFEISHPPNHTLECRYKSINKPPLKNELDYFIINDKN